MSRPAVETAAVREGERNMAGRRWLGGLIVLGAAILVACGSGGDDDDGVAEAAAASPTATSTATPQPARTPPARDLLSEAEAQVARGLKRDLPALVTEKRTVALTEIINLLPPDAIPSIDNPQFDTVEAASAWLQAEEPVISFELNGDVRAYPLQILT